MRSEKFETHRARAKAAATMNTNEERHDGGTASDWWIDSDASALQHYSYRAVVHACATIRSQATCYVCIPVPRWLWPKHCAARAAPTNQRHGVDTSRDKVTWGNDAIQISVRNSWIRLLQWRKWHVLSRIGEDAAYLSTKAYQVKMKRKRIATTVGAAGGNR